jgi:uncharacterized protein (DUF1330 family)
VAADAIADINVTCSAGSGGYRKLAGAAIDARGGRYLVRGGKTDVLEGQWHPDCLAVLEINSVKNARAWISSTAVLDRQKSSATAPQ